MTDQAFSILVIGSSGQLGQSLQLVARNYTAYNIKFLNRAECDILNQSGMAAIFEIQKPNFVINCAAYTAVDKAEDQPLLCESINATGAANVAKLCDTYKATLIHISTDFVFNGVACKVLSETDPTHPINVYGRTKLQGEQQIASIASRFFILRTSWLYSEFGSNFVKTMLRLAQEKEIIHVISDQIGTPTYALDLAEAIFTVIQSDSQNYGIYHYSNEGISSWYDFAYAALKENGNKTKVLPIFTEDYPTKATRPPFSVLDKRKFKETFNIEIPNWLHSLSRCIEALKK